MAARKAASTVPGAQAGAAPAGPLLVLLGGVDPRAPIAWLQLDPATGGVIEQGVLTEASPAPPASPPARTVLVIPGMDVQIRRLELAAQTTAQARAAAAMLFEGVLAAAGAAHHAVSEAEAPGGPRLAAAIDPQRLGEWLERCRGHGLDPYAVHVDCLLWPPHGDSVDVVIGTDRTIVAAGPRGGYALDPQLAAAVFRPWLDQIGAAPDTVLVRGGETRPWAVQAPSSTVVAQAPLGDPAAILAASALAPPAHSPNLRQGDFAPTAGTAGNWAAWRFAGVLVVLAICLQVAALTVQGVRDRQAAAQTLAEAERQFRAARPDVERVVNLRAQIKAALNAAGLTAAHPLIATNEPLVAALRAQPQVRLDELRFDSAADSLVLRLSAPETAMLDAVGRDLAARGLTFQPGAAKLAEGRHTIDLTVETP